MPIYFKHTVALLVKAEHNPVVLSVLVNHFASYQWTWVAVWKLCLWYSVLVYVPPPPSKARGREASLEHDSCRKATAVLVTSSQEEDRILRGGRLLSGTTGKVFLSLYWTRERRTRARPLQEAVLGHLYPRNTAESSPVLKKGL